MGLDRPAHRLSHPAPLRGRRWSDPSLSRVRREDPAGEYDDEEDEAEAGGDWAAQLMRHRAGLSSFPSHPSSFGGPGRWKLGLPRNMRQTSAFNFS